MMRENVYFDDVNSKNLQLLRGPHPPSDTPLQVRRYQRFALTATVGLGESPKFFLN